MVQHPSDAVFYVGSNQPSARRHGQVWIDGGDILIDIT